MIQGIKKYNLQKAIEEHNNAKYSPPSGINEGNKILIVALFEDRKSVDPYVEELRKLGKRPKLLYFGKSVAQPDNNTYTKDELNWAGVPQSGNVEKRLASNYDMCIFLAQEELPHFHYILALVKASFKIGPKVKGLEDYLDLVIDTKTKDIDFLISELKRNLAILSISA